jgi:catechol 1,2-dioxygenase
VAGELPERRHPIPVDGPLGQLLGGMARHLYRPAHIHLIATAGGYAPVTTQVFDADSPYLDSDAVFGSRRARRGRSPRSMTPPAAALGPPNPCRSVKFDVTLLPQAEPHVRSSGSRAAAWAMATGSGR